jgi:hypothetical protein
MLSCPAEHLRELVNPRERYLVTTSEFDAVKDRLTQLQDQKGPTERERAPSLKRGTSPRRNPNEDEDTARDKDGNKTKPEDREPDSDDAPPVLKRPQDRQ